MNWKVAAGLLRDGYKITRPNWEENHYWELSKDGFERILCHDGTNARVHIKQLEENDWVLWEGYKETLWRKRIGNPHYYGDAFDIIEVRKSVRKLKNKIEEDCEELVEENFDGTHFVDWIKINEIIKEIFGDELC